MINPNLIYIDVLSKLEFTNIFDSLFIAIIGIVIIFLAFYIKAKMEDMKKWPKVKATVVSCEKNKMKQSLNTAVTYYEILFKIDYDGQFMECNYLSNDSFEIGASVDGIYNPAKNQFLLEEDNKNNISKGYVLIAGFGLLLVTEAILNSVMSGLILFVPVILFILFIIVFALINKRS